MYFLGCGQNAGGHRCLTVGVAVDYSDHNLTVTLTLLKY